jgi:hypothetical protein
MQIGPDEPSAPPTGEEAADGDQEARGREHCSAECSTEVCIGFGIFLAQHHSPGGY